MDQARQNATDAQQDAKYMNEAFEKDFADIGLLSAKMISELS